MRIRFSRANQSTRENPCSNYQESRKKTKLHNCLTFVEGLSQSHIDSLAVGSDSVNSHEPGKLFPVTDPTPQSLLPLLSSAGLPMPHCMVLHLFLSLAGWRLSGDNQAHLRASSLLPGVLVGAILGDLWKLPFSALSLSTHRCNPMPQVPMCPSPVRISPLFLPPR